MLSNYLQSEDNQKQYAAVQFYNNQVNGQLKLLRELANKVRVNESLTARERKNQVEEIVNMQNIVKRQLLNVFDDLGVRP